MKTLIELGVEPKIGMIIMSRSRNLKHQIVDIFKIDNDLYCSTVNENGSRSARPYDEIKNNWLFIGMCKTKFKQLFEVSDIGYEKIIEAKKLIKQIEDLWK